jgi:hypothetical protein
LNCFCVYWWYWYWCCCRDVSQVMPSAIDDLHLTCVWYWYWCCCWDVSRVMPSCAWYAALTSPHVCSQTGVALLSGTVLYARDVKCCPFLELRGLCCDVNHIVMCDGAWLQCAARAERINTWAEVSLSMILSCSRALADLPRRRVRWC